MSPHAQTPLAITIGTFDGVHAGHRRLVRACREHAGPSGRVVALAFDPHPLTRVRPQAAPARLTTFELKQVMLLRAGADEVAQLRPDDALLNESPEEFVRWLRDTYTPTHVVEGADFKFGHNRAGDVEVLRKLGATHGFRVHVVDQVDVVLSDHTIVRASSSVVRWLLEHGRVDDAARVLGRPHAISGTVQQGDRKGRTIGFPTANLRQDDGVLEPCNGVYACRAMMPDGSTVGAAVNIGVRPTLNGVERRIEAHLLAETGQSVCGGLPEYGWRLQLEFLAWVREELRFASLDALRGQIERDVKRVRDVVERERRSGAVESPALGKDSMCTRA